MPGYPTAPGALAQKLAAVSQRLEALGEQIATLQENGHDRTIRKLEDLLADEKKKLREAIHECGQKDAVIKMLKRRADKLEKLLRAQWNKRSQTPMERP